MDLPKQLFLMLGFPGAGKTTVAKLLSQVVDAEFIQADHERKKAFGGPPYDSFKNEHIYQQLNGRAEKCLSIGRHVVYDAAFNYYADRKKMEIIAKKQNAGIIVIWVKTPRLLAKRRAVTVDDQSRIGKMDGDQFEKFCLKLEKPRTSEKVVIVDGSKVNKATIMQLLGDVKQIMRNNL